MRMYDIAIVGAGPAGATLARLLASRYQVLLIDRRDLAHQASPGAITKCCGGLLAPDAQKVLAELGLGLPEEVLVGPQLFVVRTIDLDQSHERYYQRFYVNIDREKFDRWLVSLVPDSVTRYFGTTLCGYQSEQGAITLTLQQAGSRWQEKARFLVGADGANSLVRRQATTTAMHLRQYVAIQERFRVEQPMPYFTALFASRVTDFYGWTIPKRNELLVGVALKPGRQAESLFQEFKLRLLRYGLSWGERTRREGAFLLRPQANQPLPVLGGVALVGEAAGWISPSSAEGVSYALRSAMMLADSLQPGLAGALGRYQKATGRLRLNLLGKNLKSPAMYNPQLRTLAMRSGLLSVKVRSTN